MDEKSINELKKIVESNIEDDFEDIPIDVPIDILEIPKDYFPNTDKRYKKPDSNEWNPKKMREHYNEIVRRIILGEKNIDIAKAVDLSAMVVSKVRNSPMVQEKIRLLELQRDANTVDIARDIRKLAPDALKVLQDLMVNAQTNPNVRSNIAKDLLDRAGHGAVKKTESKNLHAHLTSDELSGIKERALEAGRASGMVIDLGEEDEQV